LPRPTVSEMEAIAVVKREKEFEQLKAKTLSCNVGMVS
jgi:hypothetical protein